MNSPPSAHIISADFHRLVTLHVAAKVAGAAGADKAVAPPARQTSLTSALAATEDISVDLIPAFSFKNEVR